MGGLSEELVHSLGDVTPYIVNANMNPTPEIIGIGNDIPVMF
jgi:hypothetical protein